MVWHAPSRPRTHCFRSARVDEAVTNWFREHFVRSLRASHIRIGFTLLHETKEGFTGKLLLDGFCLTGLIGGRRNGAR
jgi:hypothetical protein